MASEHEELSARIIGAAIELHRRVGTGFLGSVYEKTLSLVEQKAGPGDGRRITYCIPRTRILMGRGRSGGEHLATDGRGEWPGRYKKKSIYPLMEH